MLPGHVGGNSGRITDILPCSQRAYIYAVVTRLSCWCRRGGPTMLAAEPGGGGWGGGGGGREEGLFFEQIPVQHSLRC